RNVGGDLAEVRLRLRIRFATAAQPFGGAARRGSVGAAGRPEGLQQLVGVRLELLLGGADEAARLGLGEALLEADAQAQQFALDLGGLGLERVALLGEALRFGLVLVLDLLEPLLRALGLI